MGKFVDSYGSLVEDRCKILIESNYNYEFLNGREASVEWDAEKGMYKYSVSFNNHNHTSDFHGIHKFKLISNP
ncbi:MAG: hypothetical protein H7Y13_11955 [Sphingobacteriaceae bacterium]|nr:hypothetical protein [Sphingobacteriaceae bacterium]